MNALSIRTKLVVLFAGLVTVPLVVALAWLGITAHHSVLSAGRALTGVADESLRQSASDVARLTADSADRSSTELVMIGRQALTGFAEKEITASEQTLRRSADHLTRTGTAATQSATERIAAASAGAVSDANTRLRHQQRQAIGAVSQALIGSSRRAFDRIGRDLTARSEEMVIRLARDLNRERSRRTRDFVQLFLQRNIDAVAQAAAEPRMLNADPYVATRLRQLVDQHRVALTRAELLTDAGESIAEWPPPFPAAGGAPAPGPPSSNPGEPAGRLPGVAAAALATDQPKLSPVQFGPPGTSPVMTIAVAVRGGAGRSPGAAPKGRRVLVATLSLEVLSHTLERQVLGGEQAAPVFVMTREGQVLAHSDPNNIGTFLSLPGRAGVQRLDADSVLFASPGGGRQQLLYARTDIPFLGWVVVAVQPLAKLMAQTEELQRAIRSTAEAAANEMAREAGTHAGHLEAATLQEQRRVAEETALQVRRESREVARAAVTALVRQQDAIAKGAVNRMQRDSQAASQVAAQAMDHAANRIALQSAERIRSDATRRAKLDLASMHALAGQTADDAAGRIIGQSGGILIIALLLALLAALLTAQSAVRPITALATGARSIAEGDFSHRVPIASEDELGQLAASFNQMATSIEASRAELQASNAILAQEKRRIQTIVDHSPDGLLILNADGSVGYANPSARSLLPWREPARGNGSLPLEAVLPPLLLRSLHHCLKAIDAGRAPVCDLRLDSPRRILQIRSVALESGSAGLGRLVHLHDVTREREIDEMKSSFVMLVSHELRTPLTSILGFSSYMLMGKMGPLTDAQRVGLESIQRQAHRLKAIAADFLDLSRIDVGQLEVRRERVDVTQVARRVLEELSPQASERGLWLRLASGTDGPALAMGDEERIAQIFTNLLHNGIKFTEQGGVEVAIVPGQDVVRVEVRDTGIGIPEEEQARIFDRFYQVERVVTRRAGGTGLGLSIVKTLVQAHGGEVGVSSSSEAGTTFYFTLPAAAQTPVVRRQTVDRRR